MIQHTFLVEKVSVKVYPALFLLFLYMPPPLIHNTNTSTNNSTNNNTTNNNTITTHTPTTNTPTRSTTAPARHHHNTSTITTPAPAHLAQPPKVNAQTTRTRARQAFQNASQGERMTTKRPRNDYEKRLKTTLDSPIITYYNVCYG